MAVLRTQIVSSTEGFTTDTRSIEPESPGARAPSVQDNTEPETDGATVALA